MRPQLTTRCRRHGFTIGLLWVLLLAALFPGPGVEGGVLQTQWTTKLGVWMIFFLQGLSLPLRQLALGYRPVRLLLFVLAWNFLLFPVVVLLGCRLLSNWVSEGLLLGFALLSIMPTTIASAVALTDVAGGRTENAICATVLSNLLAVLVVPIWVAFYLQSSASIELPLLPLLSKLSLLIVLPLFLGQILRLRFQWARGFAGGWSKRISSWIILFIVYAAFADSIHSGYFVAFTWVQLVALTFAAIVLALMVAGFVRLTSGALRVTPAQRIAAFFCASQKSLATGLPLATAIFAVMPESFVVNTGLLLLPLIIFHPVQLIIAGVWAERQRTT